MLKNLKTLRSAELALLLLLPVLPLCRQVCVLFLNHIYQSFNDIIIFFQLPAAFVADRPILRQQILSGCQPHWNLMDPLSPEALAALNAALNAALKEKGIEKGPLEKGIEKPTFETANIGVFPPLNAALMALPRYLPGGPLEHLVCWQPIEAMKPPSIPVSLLLIS